MDEYTAYQDNVVRPEKEKEEIKEWEKLEANKE